MIISLSSRYGSPCQRNTRSCDSNLCCTFDTKCLPVALVAFLCRLNHAESWFGFLVSLRFTRVKDHGSQNRRGLDWLQHRQFCASGVHGSPPMCLCNLYSNHCYTTPRNYRSIMPPAHCVSPNSLGHRVRNKCAETMACKPASVAQHLVQRCAYADVHLYATL